MISVQLSVLFFLFASFFFTLCFLLCQVGRDYKVLGDILEETEPELIRTAGQIDEQALSGIIPFTKAYFLW